MERFTNPAYSFTAYCRARSAGELRQAEIGGSARADEMVRSRPNPLRGHSYIVHGKCSYVRQDQTHWRTM
jgi:hypothetical protein